MDKKPFYEGRLPGQVGEPYLGKVRDIYDLGDILVSVTSDRISAFDHILPIEIENKGAILNLIAVEMMKKTEDIVANCLLDVPNSRTAIWRKCKPIKVEFVVRGYMEGSYWRDYYSKGEKDPWGNELPAGLKLQQKLPEPIITPTTKADDGEHDEAVSWEEIIEKGLLADQKIIQQDVADHLKKICLKLFARGQEIANERGLILVDTKYEFGWGKDGLLYLIDEIHTPDSSRYYYLSTYQTYFEQAFPQGQLSKEFVRKYLSDSGFEGKEGQTMPAFPKNIVTSIEKNYNLLYEELMGRKLNPTELYLSRKKENQLEDIIISIPKARAKVTTPVIGIVMGSDSDLEVMKAAADLLVEWRISFEMGILSAHRTPNYVPEYASTASGRGLKVIIAGAGGAAHLPGMVAASTILPVIGVPVQQKSSTVEIDSLLSIVQMPPGVPVATVGINRAQNAALLALQIMAINDHRLSVSLAEYKKSLIAGVNEKRKEMLAKYPFSF